MENSGIWVFCGDGSTLPSGVFHDLTRPEAWIKEYSLSGVLTEYPLDVCVYDWATANGYFQPRYPSQQAPEFIGRFSSAYLKHFHFENGEKRA